MLNHIHDAQLTEITIIKNQQANAVISYTVSIDTMCIYDDCYNNIICVW